MTEMKFRPWQKMIALATLSVGCGLGLGKLALKGYDAYLNVEARKANPLFVTLGGYETVDEINLPPDEQFEVDFDQEQMKGYLAERAKLDHVVAQSLYGNDASSRRFQGWNLMLSEAAQIKNPVVRLAAINNWVGSTILYDRYRNDHGPASLAEAAYWIQPPQKVISSGKAVCGGMTNLVGEACIRTGTKMQDVAMITSEYDYWKNGKHLLGAHAQLGVNIDGQIYIADPANHSFSIAQRDFSRPGSNTITLVPIAAIRLDGKLDGTYEQTYRQIAGNGFQKNEDAFTPLDMQLYEAISLDGKLLGLLNGISSTPPGMKPGQVAPGTGHAIRRFGSPSPGA